MANPNLKFFKSSVAPENPIQGYVWFNTSDRTINVYTGGASNNGWEPYAGKLSDAKWDSTGQKLTLSKADGSTIELDFSDIASASSIQTAIQGLQSGINTNAQAIAANDTAIKANAKAISDEATARSEADEALGGRIDGVSAAVSAEETRAKGVEEGLDSRLDAAEQAIAGLASATHFIGVKDELPAAEESAAGDIVIVGNKEYVYDVTKGWVELGDTSAELAAIDANAANIAKNAQAIAQNKAAIESNDADILALQNEVAGVKNDYATKASVQASVADLQGQITSNDTDIQNINAAAETLAGRVSKNETDIAGINQTLATLATSEKVTELEGELDAVAVRMTTAEGKITAIEGDVASFKTNVASTYATKAELKATDDKAVQNAKDIEALEAKDGEIDTEIANLKTADSNNAKALSDYKTEADGKFETKQHATDTWATKTALAEEVAAREATDARVAVVEGLLTWGSFE